MSEKTAQSPSQGPSPIGEISQEPSAFEAFLDANQKRLVIAGIIAIIALVAYVIYDGLNKIAIKDRAAAYAEARTVPEYEAVAKKFEGTNAGGSALISKSQVQWADLQQQEAIKTLEEFISGYPEHPALGSAKSTLGSYYQQLGNLEKAKSYFTEAASLKDATSSLALLALGDIAAQEGESEKAKEFYNSIISEYGTSHPQVKTLASQRLKIVGIQSPTEAAPEPTPPQPTTTPATGVPAGISRPVVVPAQKPVVTPTPDAPAADAPTPPTEATDTPENAETSAPAEDAQPEESAEAVEAVDSPEGN